MNSMCTLKDMLMDLKHIDLIELGDGKVRAILKIKLMEAEREDNSNV